MRIRSLILLILLVSALCLPAALVFTGAGSRLVLWVAERATGIDLEYGSGALGNALHLRQLDLQQQGFSLTAEDLHVRLNARCLLRLALCLQQVQAGQVVMELRASDTGTQSEDASPALLRFPVDVLIKELSVSALQVSWPGGQWSQGAMLATLGLRDHDVTISAITIAEPQLRLANEAPSASAATGSIVQPEKRIAPPVVSLPFRLRVNNATLTQPAVTMADTQHRFDALSLRGQWLRDELVLPSMTAHSNALGSLALSDGAITFSDDWPVSAALQITTAKELPWPQFKLLQERDITLAVDGDLAALALELAASASPGVSASATVDLLSSTLPFEGDLTIDTEQPLALDKLLGLNGSLADTALSGSVSVAARGTIDEQTLLPTAKVTLPQYGLLALNGSLVVSNDSLRIDRFRLHQIEAAANNVADNKPGVGASLEAEGAVSWHDGIAWSLQARAVAVDIPLQMQPVHGQLGGTFSTSGAVSAGALTQLQFNDIHLYGTVNSAPANVTGDIYWADNAIGRSSALRADVRDAQLSLQRADATSSDLQLTAQIAELGSWSTRAAGAIQFDARIAADGSGLTLQAEGANLRYQDLAISAANLHGSYTTAQSGREFPGFDARLNLQGVAQGAYQLESVVLTARNDASGLQALLQSSGAVEGQLRLSGPALARQWRGEIAPTRLSFGGLAWDLTEPLAVAHADDMTTVLAHCWQHAAAQLCASDWAIQANGRKGAGEFNFAGDVGLLSTLLPPDTRLSGAARATASVAWSQDAPIAAAFEASTGQLLLIRTLQEEEQRSVQWQRMTAKASYTAGELVAQAALYNRERAELLLDLRLPRHSHLPIAGSLQVDQLHLGGIASLSTALSGLEGRVSGTLELQGSVGKPLLYGALNLNAGRIKHAVNPTALEDLEFDITALGDSAQLSGSGLLGGGPVSIDGEFLTAPEMQLTLRVQGDDNTILYPPSTRASLSHRLNISASMDAVAVSGDINIDDGVWEYTELPDNGVALSNDVVLVDSAGRGIAQQSSLEVSLDIRVRVNEAFRVRGPQLEAGLSGDLQLRQKPRQPLQLFGSLQTSGGYANAYERTLQIKRGTISFTGAPENPLVDLRAVRNISDEGVVAGVHVHGALETNLSLDIYSEPPMPQNEAMSYLIWGRGLDSATSADSTVLALSLASNVANRSSLVSTINSVPGIDNVSFGAEGGDQDATATVSGYVGERLYLSYGIGLYDPINVLTARFFLRTRLWLEVVSRLENSLDLYYSFDID